MVQFVGTEKNEILKNKTVPYFSVYYSFIAIQNLLLIYQIIEIPVFRQKYTTGCIEAMKVSNDNL
jgi:hypothetical protein